MIKVLWEILQKLKVQHGYLWEVEPAVFVNKCSDMSGYWSSFRTELYYYAITFFKERKNHLTVKDWLYFPHTECHLSATRQCNSTLLTVLSTSQHNRIGVNNRKKLPKRWHTSRQGKNLLRGGRVVKLLHCLVRKENWIMWPSVKLTSYWNQVLIQCERT